MTLLVLLLILVLFGYSLYHEIHLSTSNTETIPHYKLMVRKMYLVIFIFYLEQRYLQDCY